MKFVRTFKEIDKKDASIAGGKGANLGEMVKIGIPVPPGFVVLAESFDNFLKETAVSIEIDAMWQRINIKDIENVEKNSEIIKHHILKQKFPEELAKEIIAAFDKLGAKYVAVRSSATAEDFKVDAWAGQLESELYVKRNELLKSVQKCWASLFTSRAMVYRVEKGLLKKHISVAVAVQKMINSEVSGVCFTVHPVTKNKNQMIIEAVLGLGESLVQGLVTPDSYIIDKTGLRILDINVNEQRKMIIRSEKGTKNILVLKLKQNKQKLSGKRIIELAKICIVIENNYKIPQDIEWTLEKGRFYIVQTRPITTL